MRLAILLLFSYLTCGLVQARQPTQTPVKNILFLISDDLKASVLGCYGDPNCQTVNIDRLASKGVVFERAYCQGTTCGPSRTSLMHSRYVGSASTNLGKHLKTHGKYSARVGKIYHMRVPGDIIAGTNGLDIASSWTERFNSMGLEAHTPGLYACLNQNIFTKSLENRESTKMRHRMFVTVQYEGDGSDQPDHKSASKAIELMRAHRNDTEGFFLAVGFVRPHYPMVAPRQYFAPYPWSKIELPTTTSNDLDDIPKLGIAGTVSRSNPIGKYPDNQKRMWQGYYASVQFMDEQVGRVLDELDRLGLRDSTAIIFTSDHGYHLGEHGFWQKANLHEEVLRVPLIIDAPNAVAGRRRQIVELVDLFPTICELTETPIPDSVQGTSLSPVLTNPNAKTKGSALSFNKGFSLRTDNWHYMRYHDGTRELYDMQSDPNEFRNLATNQEFAHIVRDHELELKQLLTKHALRDTTQPTRKNKAP